MNGYLIPVICPHCGGEVSHVNASKAIAGSSCCAIAQCVDCFRDWQVSVLLRPVHKPDSLRKTMRRERARASA